jgi:hypothetical protein
VFKTVAMVQKWHYSLKNKEVKRKEQKSIQIMDACQEHFNLQKML